MSAEWIFGVVIQILWFPVNEIVNFFCGVNYSGIHVGVGMRRPVNDPSVPPLTLIVGDFTVVKFNRIVSPLTSLMPWIILSSVTL
jgi:hypothetical protein